MGDGEGELVSIRQRLLKERNALLDLSTRNRLLNTPLRTRNNRAIEVVDESAVETFRLLTEGRSLTFLPGATPADDASTADGSDEQGLGAPPALVDDDVDERGVPLRHLDSRLQTRLSPDNLQKRLFDIWYDARSVEEEQGVNILFVAFGLLRWYDANASDVVRHAPLVLLPVQLERTSAADRFKLKWRHEPPSPNLTLQAKLKSEFGLLLEDFQDEDSLDLPAYFARVAATVSGQSRWEVLPDAMVLGFFSFAKFLMYRDLDPDCWPSTGGVDDHPLITALLRDGFPESAPLIEGDEAPIDAVIPPMAQNHVVDADSSQAVAIAEAAGGRTLVVKGPPGTGKSQTITNIIAASAALGKKVLFVAEKRAALEVVWRRLQQAGLGPLTLELHSNKANKRAVLEELRRTRDGAARKPRIGESVIGELGVAIDELNAFADRLHRPLQPSGLTPHQIIARLLQAAGSTDAARLDGALGWSFADAAQRRRLVQELTDRASAIAPLRSHAWRGVGCDPLDPYEREEVGRQVAAVAATLATSRRIAGAAADLGLTDAATVRGLAEAAAALDAAAALPPGVDRRALADPLWRGHADGPTALARAGAARSSALVALGGQANTAGMKADLSAIRAAVATKGRNWLRFLDGDYRRQIALLKSYLKVELPGPAAARLDLIDRISAAQDAEAAYGRALPAAQAFGASWRGEDSDWPALCTLAEWRVRLQGVPDETCARIAAISDWGDLCLAAHDLQGAMTELNRRLGDLFGLLGLDVRLAFSVPGREDIKLDEIEARLALWAADLEGLSRYITYAACGRQAGGLGLEELVAALDLGRIEPAALPSAFEHAYTGVLRSALFEDWPALKAFDGVSRDRLVDGFRQLDRQRIALAREQIAARHAAERPQGGGIGPLGILNGELAKKSRFRPIRKLLEDAGPAVQQLKPVFMMSPLSVAQYLKAGAIGFDLLVMDEASQIEPVDALGAIARTRQIVVVGDERQLPPTAFFKKLAGDEDDEPEDDDGVALQARDAESILDLCLAKGAPYRMLNWHYRSKHQSLIAVSNREFYENRLFIVPSPYDCAADMGLKFHLLENAPYDRGGTRTNPTEARVIAERVIRHARETPELSLGVATFSVVQRTAVLNALELLRRKNADVEPFFAASGPEPFFVKNLENIQGDERDVIFISVGYGKTAEGYLAHGFGPVSSEGGERRLNVLISRAKIRCEVFCNFSGSEIDPERGRARGTMALKMFLTFAETGEFGLGVETGLDHDSEFEAQVADRLRARGHQVKAQIGASGFRVDLAISDPGRPGRFVLGIECDGAQYHASRSARDRDRLRQQVLEAHGWIIHRIWSADWYLRPTEEMRKLEDALAAAMAEWRDRDAGAVTPTRAPPPSSDVQDDDDNDGDDTLVAKIAEAAAAATASGTRGPPYREAAFPVDRDCPPHQIYPPVMADYVVQVVEAEGPVHLDEVASRLRSLWGLSRAGGRIRAAVARGADIARTQGRITGEDFLSVPGHEPEVRDRSAVESASLRKPDMLPPAEIDACLIKVVKANFGAPAEALPLEAARAFGFAATSGQLRAVLNDGVERLKASGALAERNGLLVVP